MTGTPLPHLSAAASALDIAAAVRDGRLRAVDVVRTHLDVIDARDPELNAFQSVRRDAALAEAADIDASPHRAGLPLAGVPVAIKDNIAVRGEEVRHGSAATAGRPPAERRYLAWERIPMRNANMPKTANRISGSST